MKKVLAIMLIAALAIGLAACGAPAPAASSAPAQSQDAAGGDAASGGDAAASGEKLKVALVLPGKKDDVSFNQAMYRGMTEYANANPDNIDLKVVEGVYEVSDIDPTLREYADNGYDVIIGHGYQFGEPINTVAKEYPEICFLVGGNTSAEPNGAGYDIELEQGGYVMGVLAALASQSGKIGVVGGGEGSQITRGHEGFKMGAKSVKPDIEIQEVYTGDWNDTTGAYEAAVGMYDSGVDIIWHSGDGIGLGVVQAAEEKDGYVLGNVENQEALAPNNVLSGLQYEWATALEQIFDSIYDGTFVNTPDKPEYYINVSNKGLSMTEINDPKGWVTDDIKAQVQDVIKQIEDGKIDLSSTYSQQ